MQQRATPPPAPVTCSLATNLQTCSTAWSRLGSSTGRPTQITSASMVYPISQYMLHVLSYHFLLCVCMFGK